MNRTIRENAEDSRAKTVRCLGMTIIVAWSLVFTQVARADELIVAADRSAICAVAEYAQR